MNRELLLAIIFSLTLQPMILYDFNENDNLNSWFIVDDGVMGGRSRGSFQINEDSHAEFSGNISLENNGGFSSVRHDIGLIEISNYSKFIIRLKGDGKNYQFRAKSNQRQRYSYIGTLITTREWQIIEIEFSDMYPSFRGYRLNEPNFKGATLSEVAFLFGNKKMESFKLEIDYIHLK